VSLTVASVNGAPTAVNDGPIYVGSTPTILTAAQLVGNDTDPEGGTLFVHSVTPGTNGTVVLNGDGTVTFTPTANYSGPATFTYKVKDAAGLVSANSATVSLSVSTLTVLHAVTDNYKNGDLGSPESPTRLNETYLPFGGLKANGVTYKLIDPPNGYTFVGEQLTVVGDDPGHTIGTVTFDSTHPNAGPQRIFRRDGVDKVPPNGNYGLIMYLNDPAQLEASPIPVTITLTVNGVAYRTTAEYRYDAAIHDAPHGTKEWNNAGGRWYVAGVRTDTDWEPNSNL
jgi:hypothetical protein